MVNKKVILVIVCLMILTIGITAQVLSNISIKESNKRIVANINGTERSYPLDIRNQTRYDQYGRVIAEDWDRLEEYIEKDIIEINKPEIPEVFK